MVEAALVLIILFSLLLGIFDYGRFVMTRQLLENATREGARLAVANTDKVSAVDIQNWVTLRMAGQSPQNMTVQVYKADPTTGANIGAWTDAGAGECIAVEVKGDFRPVIPKLTLIPNPLALKAKVVMFSEANR
jgi:Flp pilus assembly protein TadG